MRIDIKPMGAVRSTQKGYWKPNVLRYSQWKKDLRNLLPNYELPEKVYLVFYLEMPKSWSEKKRVSLDDKPHQQTPDIDNLAKAVMDALAPPKANGKGVDDSYVWKIQAEKLWARESYIEIVEL